MTRWFNRWARKQGLPLELTCAVTDEMRSGLIGADLGGRLYKKRIGGQGRGKSGAYRILIATDRESRWFFIFGFAKSERSALEAGELIGLRRLSMELLSMTSRDVRESVVENELIEVTCEEEKVVSRPGGRA